MPFSEKSMNATLANPAASGGLIRPLIAALLAGLIMASCEPHSPATEYNGNMDNDSHGRSISDPHHGSGSHCDHCKH